MGSAASKRSKKSSRRKSSCITDANTQRTDVEPRRHLANEKRSVSSSADSNANNAHSDYRYSGLDFHADFHLPRYVRPSSRCTELTVVKFDVGIDGKETSLTEKSSVLKYKTPHFRAQATVEIPPLASGKRLEIGWIQVCREMTFINLYGQEGITSWEFPEIMTGKFEMISDSDGRRYPWYGAKHEVDTIRGPTKLPTPVSVTMNDNFFPQVTWHIPLKSYPREPKLTRIYRRQSFVTCLATRDPDSEASSVNILKAVKWSMEVEIAVNPTSPLGSRARLLKPREVLKPALIEDTCGLGDLIESYALKPPNANGSQTLIWRPFPSTDQSPSVIVLPGFTTVDMNSYIDDTEHLSDSLHDVIT